MATIHRVNAPIIAPTLPSFSAVDDSAVQRTPLLAGLAFVNGAATWSRTDLGDWFRTHAAVLGRHEPPGSVWDIVGDSTPYSLTGPPSARPRQLPRLLAMARWQVILTLRGMLATPADDRFLHAAIFAARVVRADGAWRVEARDTDPLSLVVLALFAADILGHREFHEQNLCVCDVCGRVSYNPRLTTRAGCPDHVPGSDVTSGVQKRGGG